jgi:hypothetical protein
MVLEPGLPPPSSRPNGEELFRLGMAHATGMGADYDMVCAHALFDLAARFGSLEAKVYRKELSEEMDPDEVGEAQRVARDWLRRL